MVLALENILTSGASPEASRSTLSSVSVGNIRNRDWVARQLATQTTVTAMAEEAGVSRQTARTMAEIAGMTFMAVQRSDGKAAFVGQSLIELQPLINMVDTGPQSGGVHQRELRMGNCE